jgi:hypothetical protein
MSQKDKKIWFIYHILSDGKPLDFTNNQPRISWSVYIKKGKKMVPIWQYHAFSKDLMERIL